MKVLLVALHLRHFQEFLGDLCDHFIVTKRGVSNQGCCNFMENNIMLKQRESKIPLACTTQMSQKRRSIEVTTCLQNVLRMSKISWWAPVSDTKVKIGLEYGDS